MNRIRFIVGVLAVAFLAGCAQESQESKDTAIADRQQSQYAKAQPIPTYDWSLERDLVRQLYDVRNQRAATHSVWRSNTGMIEGDCSSIGFGIPYDTSLTNPIRGSVYHIPGKAASYKVITTEQAEPNGIFASKNTSATWVLCVGDGGNLDPVYVESKVSVFPYPLNVDYETNRVSKAGASTATVKLKKKAKS